MDLEGERQVTYEEGSSLAKKNNALFFETSAKTGVNVESVFITVIAYIVCQLIHEINVQRDLINRKRSAMSKTKNDDLDQGCSCTKCNLF